MLTRRRLVVGLLAAPAIIRPGLLMPVVRPYVRMRHAMMVPNFPVPGFDADTVRLILSYPGLPSWITPDLPFITQTRDHGFLTGIGWERYVRS